MIQLRKYIFEYTIEGLTTEANIGSDSLRQAWDHFEQACAALGATDLAPVRVEVDGTVDAVWDDDRYSMLDCDDLSAIYEEGA